MIKQIIPSLEAVRLVYKDKKNKAIRVNEITTCNVFKLSDNRTVLIPFDSETSAIFNSFEECLNFITEEHIDEIRTGNRFEYIKHEMLNIEVTCESFIINLSKVLKREIQISNEKKYLLKLNKDLMKYGKKNIKRNLYVEVGIYLCLVLKEIVNGKWVLEEHRSKYSFFVPLIKDNDGVEYSCWKSIAESFYENRKFDILEFLHYSSIYNRIDISYDMLTLIKSDNRKI